MFVFYRYPPACRLLPVGRVGWGVSHSHPAGLPVRFWFVYLSLFHHNDEIVLSSDNKQN
jgi:hypothetical protein